MNRIRHSRIGQSDRSRLFVLTTIAIFALVAVGGLAVALFSSARGASATPPPPGALVLTYDSSKTGCPTDGSISLPFEGDLNGEVNWGDGATNSWATGDNPSHTYATAGAFNIAVTGTATQFGNGNLTWTGAKCITSVVQWGELGITSLSGALSGATNLTSVPDWLPAEVTDISFLFDGATSFNGRIGNWNTAAVTSLEGTFRGATSFNQSLNTWNTAAVTNFAETFFGATSYNRPINNWNTANGATFRAMFKNASAFNQPISITPNTANDASEMFRGASAFNQYFTMWSGGAIYGTTLKGMFRDATSFNQRVDWNISGVTDMSDMFRGATSFNGYLGSLPVHYVTDASHMFDGATSFNSDLSPWQTNSLLTTNSMFRNATSFNQSIGHFNTTNVTDMSHMFEGATSFTGGEGGSRSVSDFNTSAVLTMNSMFKDATSFNTEVGGWDVSRLTDAGSMFAGAANFDRLLSNWNVGSLTNMSNMFNGSKYFGRGNSGSGGLANWNVANVTDMTNAFANTSYFNESLSAWTTSSLERALGVFANAAAFDQSLAAWDTTHLVNGDGIGIEYSGISTPNYSKTLAAWSRQAQPSRPAGSVRLNANDKVFDRLWEQSRRFVLTRKGWSIRDAGRAAARAPLSMSYDFTSALADATVISDGGIEVHLPLTGIERLTVDWGDGATEIYGAGSTPSHFYSLIADDPELDVTYTVSVSGQATGFDSRVHDGAGMSFVSAINSWGQIGLTSLNYAFSNMTGLTAAPPQLPGTVRTVAHMYDGLVSPSAASGVIAPPATWATGSLIDMSSMFKNSNIAIADLSGWDTSNVIDMSRMFAGIPAGSSPSIAALDVNDWDVSNVEDMASMFQGSNFNASIIDWDVSNVRSMADMFAGNAAFNQPLSTWNIGRVQSLAGMFYGATSFNQSLATWNTRAVNNFRAMFDGASAFNQSLATWTLTASSDMSNLLNNTSVSSTNYAETLESFHRSGVLYVTLGASGLVYDARGTIARVRLINDRGWVIEGDTSGPAGAPMTMTYDNLGTSCGLESVNLPYANYYGLTVDWGDGSSNGGEYFSPGQALWHQFAQPGAYDIKVYGTAEQFGQENWYGVGCITKVGSYGDLGLKDLTSAWSYSNNLTALPPLPPRVIIVSKMFFSATNFNLDISMWDTSSVTNMSLMFAGATKFNQNLSGWDTSKVTDMTQMFIGAEAFNGDISTWDTSRVTSMHQMFTGARKFNAAIGEWDVSKVTSMQEMFSSAEAFNQPIGNWDTSSLISMTSMFQGAASFNRPLANWDVSRVVSMYSVFKGATRFNGDISGWDTSSVTDFMEMFAEATAFDQPIGNWNVSRGLNFVGMFQYSGFNQPIGGWTMRSLEQAERMFLGAKRFDQDLLGWDMSKVVNVASMFNGAIAFNRDLSSWNLDRVVYMNSMFYTATSFNQSLGNWNLAVMSQAYELFSDSGMSVRNYTDTLMGWDTQVTQGSMSNGGVLRSSESYYAEAQSAVDSLRSRGWTILDGGQYANSPMTISTQPDVTACGTNSVSLAFGGPIVDGYILWGDGERTDLTAPGTVSHTYADSTSKSILIYGEISTFGNGTELAGVDCITGVSQWGNLNLSGLPGAFRGWSNLVSVPSESPGRITDLSNTFRDATKFNADLRWDTSAAVTTAHMFDGATSFNGSVDGLDLGSATDTSYMFAGATTFNRSIPNWNVANTRNFSHMFDGATSFTSSILNWNTQSATDMSYMFKDAVAFNQEVQGLNVSSVTNMAGMLDGSGLSVHNYGKALKGWSSQSTMSGVTLGATGRGYRTDAAAARLSLTGTRNWTIVDDGPAPEAPMVLELDTTMESCYPNLYLPLTGVLGATVDWGDGSTPTVLGVGNDWPYHEFAQGTFTVTVSGEANSFGNGGEWQGNRCLKSVTSFGEMGMTSFNGAFASATNLTTVPSKLPSTITDTRSMFSGANRFNADISSWDTSKITTMNSMFYGASAFNRDLSLWNTSKVTDMAGMFHSALVFNGNISTWNTSKVSTMGNMFNNAQAFNGDLSTWDVRKVESMPRMFESAYSFNSDISKWNLASATDLSYWVNSAYSWNQSLVGIKLPVLNSAYESLWATSMSPRNYSDTLIYFGAEVAAGRMPSNATLTTTTQYFADAVPARDALIVAGWTLRDNGAYDMTPMTMSWDPAGTACGITQLDLAFSGPNLAATIDWGDGSTPTAVTAGINSHAYTDTDPHTVSISGQASTFGNGTALAGGPCITSVGQWGNLQLKSMPGAFRGWSKLTTVPPNAPGNIVDFSNTFRDATIFNADLYWELGSTKTTAHMFDGAKAFNGWIDGWNMTNVVDASYMFAGATSFNRNTDSWPLVNVRNLSHIFDGATNFGGHVTSWRPSKVTDLSYAFNGVRNFDTDISNFDISNVTDMTGIFTNSGLTTFTYDNILAAWSQLDVKRNVTLGATGRPYRASVASARDHLVSNKGWTIIDDGLADATPMKFTLDTTVPGCDPNVSMPFFDVRDVTVNWGDGSDPVRQTRGSDWLAHSYSAAGVYHVEVAGDVYSFGNFNYTWQGAGCLTSVESFGGLGLRAMPSAFEGAINLTAVPATLPTSVTDTRRMFVGNTSFNDDISGWDVSRLTDMSFMFAGATIFNKPLNAWDVSRVTSLNSMFNGAWAFNQPLDEWDVSNVVNLESVFYDARAFNGDISSWDTGSVALMPQMFRSASAFNGDLSGWDVSRVVDMNYMFMGASSFDQSLGAWKLDRLVSAYGFLDGSRMSPLHYGESLKGWAGSPTTANNVGMSSGILYSASAQAARAILVNKGWDIADYGVNTVSPMVLTVDNRLASCSGLTQTLPVGGTFRDEVIIDWGDGTTTAVVEGTTPSHTYATADLYTISISGLPERFGTDVTGSEAAYVGADCITSVTAWGGSPFTNFEGAFRGAKNLTAVPNYIPSTVTNLSWMFAGATSFNGDMAYWDLNNVRDLSHMFDGATAFNVNINNWNVQYVRDMSSMFKGATSFQGYVTNWHPERVTNMSSMFEGASLFNADIRNWEVASVTNMANMFDRSGLTTWIYGILLNSWSSQALQENVTLGASTTQFRTKSETVRNHLIDDLGWTIVDGGLLPNIPMVMTIDTSKAECNGAVTFPFTTIRDMTIDYGDGSDPVVLGPSQDYPTYTYSSVGVFTVTVHGEVDGFGQYGGWPGAGCLTSMSSFGELGLVSLASAFNTAVNLTDVPATLPSTVTDTSRMFAGATSFNEDISAWDVSRVTTMQAMFQNASSFNQLIGSWNTGRVTDLSWMFSTASVFNQNLASWNTSRVTTLEGTFQAASAFNGTVGGWNTSRVENMTYTFDGAAAFNQPVNAWNFSNVASTQRMFYDAISFNQPVDSWNTGKVMNMMDMFRYASAFNQPVNTWDVSKVTYMSNMFTDAVKFNQPLDGWHPASLQSAGDLMSGTAVSPDNYGKTLMAWASYTDTPYNVYMTNGSLKYSAAAALSREALIIAGGWNIGDAGVYSSVPMSITVDTSLTGCDAATIEIPVGGAVYDTPIVDWGDGSTSVYAAGTFPSHVYASAGQYTVSVSGVFSHFGDPTGYEGAQCITGITEWGDTATTDLSGAFKGATNLAALPTLPAAVTDLSSAFAAQPTFNLDMSGWDVSNVEHFDNMFAQATSFNSDITGWDTSSAKTMNGMFKGATSFNRDISVWDVSNVTSMGSMFDGATAFDHYLGDWQLNSVISMADSFARSSISEENWTATLTGWAANDNVAENVAIDASGHTWLASASAAHAALTIKGWVFTNDGGLVDIPVIVSAPTVVHGDQKVTVSWTALTEAERVGADIDQYSITAFASADSVAGSCQPTPATGLTCEVTGLTNGTAYIFKLKAHNRIGWSDYSQSSNTATPSTVPAKSVIASTTRGNAQVTVTWTAPATNGAPITGYVVTAYAGGISTGRTCSPSPATGLTCDVTGLTNGTAYTFKLVASNLNGPGATSDASGSVTPMAAPEQGAAPSVVRGNAQVSVTWVAPGNNGSAITGYTVATYAGGTLVNGKTCTPSPATALTCTVTGLTNGTAYTFKVRATNLVGTTDSLASLEATPATLPSVPAAPSVVRGNAKVTVSWVAPNNGGSDITGYTVSTFAGGTLVAGKTCSPTPATGLTCDVTGLTNGTAYTFKVKATNVINTSADSAASVAVTPATTPNAPAVPTVARAGSGIVKVTWIAPTANGGSAITGYTATAYAAGVSTGKTCTTAATTVTCNVTGLTNGTAYTFTVKATNAVGFAESAASSAVTPAVAPAAPAAPTVVKGHQSVQVKWVAPDANGSPITGYTVTAFAGATAVTGKTCPLNPATATTCVMTGLTNGTAYTFKVKATNALGSSADSVASVAVTPAAVPATPAAPTIKVGAAVGTGKATITWVAPANNGSAITGFTATAYTAAGVSSGTCTTAAATALTCSITGLTNGTAYTFKVTAKNANGTSFESPGATATPSATAVAGVAGKVPATPAAPTVRVGGTVTAKTAAITWVAPANGGSAITGYTVTASTGTGAVAGTCTSSGTAVTCSIAGLTTGTTYTFTVVATNAVGNSTASPGTTGIPT